jgi:uncharacterized protein (TIGR03437 family)
MTTIEDYNQSIPGRPTPRKIEVEEDRVRRRHLGFVIPVLWGIAHAQQPSSFTSHDKIALTYLFYWYDAPSGFHYGDNLITQVTLHPPDSYLSSYSYKNPAFFQREFSDMVAAGVDVALPVFWGNTPNVSTWSVAGLQTMVQAEQAMAKAGQPAPKIGMFDDTTSLQDLNGGTKPDLRTASGKSLFYDEIHRFFSNVPRQFWAMIDGRPIIVLFTSTFVSAWDQTTFDYASQQFQQDFGTTPYFIPDRTWTGVTTDAAYYWGAAAIGEVTIGDVTAVGPGFDNLAVSGPQAQGHLLVADRFCGQFYQRQWDQVILQGSRLVLMETWNELHEGTAIAATKEYSRRYIDQSARNVARWKASSTASPPSVWTSLGPHEYDAGLYSSLNGGDGAWLTTRIAGHDAVYTNRSSTPPGYYLYLSVDQQFLATSPSGVWVTVEYFDNGGPPWRLEYDGANNPNTVTAPATPQNTGTWKQQTFFLPDAVFRNRENAASDLRIDDFNTQGFTHYFNRVWITKSAPSGTPLKMPVVSDLVLHAGDSADVALNVADSSGKPLAASLGSAPGFASLRGSAGAQTIHLAPSLDDAVCADVTGPGIVSSPFYTISAAANDGNGLLGTGATTFSVNVTAPPPAVHAIYDAWNYTSGISPGAWVTISGTSLSAGDPQTWNVTGTQLPTSLNSVRVTFNGVPAVLAYVSPTQINALVPASVTPGAVQVVVQNNGTSSSGFPMTATAALPAIYAVPDAGGTFFVTAVLAGSGSLIGNSAVDPRVARAAVSGDVLDLYMIGLGATQDVSKWITDQIFSGAYPVSASVTATVGGKNTPVMFAGLTSPGLYLVRIQVPAGLAPGPQPIQVAVGASTTPSPLVLMVSGAP